MVTKTFMKFPPGAAVPPAGTVVALDAAAQEGGSLMDTFIVPMLELCIMGGFPPQPTRNTATAVMTEIIEK
jgi:hypothetical protein